MKCLNTKSLQPIVNHNGVSSLIELKTTCKSHCGLKLSRMWCKEMSENTRNIRKEFVSTFTSTRPLNITVIKHL